MTGEKNLEILLKSAKPKHNTGDYVFCQVGDPGTTIIREAIMVFKEQEGTTVIIKRELADSLKLKYTFVASWITLTIHSSLEAVGLTAAFSTALAENGISCNVVAAFYHDHIFVDRSDTRKAMEILSRFSK
jgi:hypothetical protein